MKNDIFYFYAIIFIGNILFHLFKKKAKGEDDAVVIDPTLHTVDNIRLHIKADWIFVIFDYAWVIIGWFTIERPMFISITIITVFAPFIQNNRDVKLTKKIFRIFCAAKILLVLIILYYHFIIL